MTESPRISRLLAALAAGEAQAADLFWDEVLATGTPLIEPDGDTDLVTFLWRGKARQMSVAFAFVDTLPMSRAGETDIWLRTERLSRDLHTIYFFLRNVSAGFPGRTPGATRDPHNANTHYMGADPFDRGRQPAAVSLVTLADAAPDDWSQPRAGVARGRVLTTAVATRAWGGHRDIRVYRPAGVPTEGLPVLVAFDGWYCVHVQHFPTILDNLIAAGRIPPMVALFVSNPGSRRRMHELVANPAAVRFVTRELLPWARRRFGVTDDPARTVVTGQSLGGLVSLHVAVAAPDVVGRVVAQSPSLWWPTTDQGRTTRRYEAAQRLPGRIHLDVGALEQVDYWGSGNTMLGLSRELHEVLVKRACEVNYVEFNGGHDMVNWQRTFGDGLAYVMG